jgi:ubiquitin C-terminal hydrolase
MKKSICSLPEILIFVMSRGKNANFKCKINFPIEIDMSDFYEPINTKYRTYNTKYDLICATLAIDWYKGSGHTFAFCKTYKNNEYYLFNDSRVWKTDFSKIKDKIPYILFYEKRK